MSRTAEQMQQSLELMLNEIAADQEVNRIVVQCFLLNLTRARGPELLLDMKQQVLETVRNAEPNKTDAQGGQRRKELTVMRAESLFLEIEEALGIAEKGRDPSASN